MGFIRTFLGVLDNGPNPCLNREYCVKRTTLIAVTFIRKNLNSKSCERWDEPYTLNTLTTADIVETHLMRWGRITMRVGDWLAKNLTV